MYDLLIIGGGPAGYRAADIAGKRGKKVALVEAESMGGTCLHRGCIPLKLFLHAASIKEKNEKFWGNKLNGIDVKVLQDKKKNICNKLELGIISGLKRYEVEYIKGQAYIKTVDKDAIEIEVNGNALQGRNLIIATGSHADNAIANNIIADCEYKIIDSDQFLNMVDLPRKMIVIGGGAIGLEAASFAALLGIEVTIVEATSQIAGGLDEEISIALKRSLEKQGVNVLLDTHLKEFQRERLVCDKAGTDIFLQADCVLLAMGRKPNIVGYGLENTDVSYDLNGIKVNNQCQTTSPMIYACGDVTGQLMLAHVAYKQAKVAVDSICGINNTMSYEYIPKIVYTVPEAFSIGLSENDCIKKSISYEKMSLPLTYSGRYFAEYGLDTSKAKVIISKETNEILGCHMHGNDVSELALSLELMMMNHMTVDALTNMVFPHPTIGEIIYTLVEK